MQTLDLSHNDISDISDRDVFLPPLNLTNLRLSNNRLSYMPLDKILPLPNLKVLDLRDNEIGVFDEKYMRIIQNGTVLRYSGNEGSDNQIQRRAKTLAIGLSADEKPTIFVVQYFSYVQARFSFQETRCTAIVMRGR